MSAPAPELIIVDYGMGNLFSAAKAIEHVGGRATVSADPEAVAEADAIVLPGVGAFPEAMRQIGVRGLWEAIVDTANAGTPLLGICLGMQLLFEASDEHEGAEGLGLIEGVVSKLRAPLLKLPNMGWAPIRMERPAPLLEGIEDGETFYFVHSFAARPEDEELLLASAAYGERFAAIVGRGNVYGAQFHPEKSSAGGLRLLENFVSIAASARTAGLGSGGGAA